MSDEELDDDATADPAPPRPKKKKKKRRAAIAAAVGRPSPVPAAPAQTWTTGHLAAALAAGLVVGGLGGYGMWGRSAPADGAVAKDSAAAQAPTRGAQATARPQQQPTPEPATPVYIPLAAWSPREGPEHAKVTILEFSDFQ